MLPTFVKVVSGNSIGPKANFQAIHGLKSANAHSVITIICYRFSHKYPPVSLMANLSLCLIWKLKSLPLDLNISRSLEKRLIHHALDTFSFKRILMEFTSYGDELCWHVDIALSGIYHFIKVTGDVLV